MDTATKRYIERLITGVREEVSNHTIEVDSGIAIPSTWIDAAILCDVIEKEILCE